MRTLKPSPLVQAAGLYALCFALLSIIIFATPAFLGTDDYYHARVAAEIIDQRRLALDFVWLPLTILSPDRFVDHHLLFHLAIAPFVALAGVTGAKLATAAVAAGVITTAWALLRQIGVRYPALWALGLFAVSTPFLYRMLMVRTQGASLLLLILTLCALFARRYRWMLALGFAYVWLYNGFILMLILATAYSAAVWIADRRLELRPVAYTLGGIMLGLIINPYFPQNIQFIFDHLLAKVDLASSVRVGNEWYPYDTDMLMTNSTGALIAMAIGLLAPSFSKRPRDRVETTLLLTALITLFMVFRSRRFIEYFPAFALLFCAASWGRGGVDLAAFLPASPRFRPLIALLSAAALLGLGVRTYTTTLDDARAAIEPEYFAGASAWLRDNTPPGAMVFQTDWDDFTRLFYHNTNNVYLVGLDPTYLERADPELWNTWVAITRGEIADPSHIIRSSFNAEYVVSDASHDAFRDQAAADVAMELVYRDRYNYVWHLTSDTVESTRSP